MKILQYIIIIEILCCTILMAQNKPEPMSIPRLTGPITVDGLSDEAAWKNIDPLPLTMHIPEFMGVMTEMSEIRIGYNDQYLYASGRFYDSEPELIKATSYKRDGVTPGNDVFALTLDTFNDNQTALAFYTTPTGSRSDMIFSNDAEGNFINISWNTFWEAATIRNEEGWFVEVRIPFSSLRFQTENGDVIIGLMAWRWIARKGEVHSYPALEPKWNNAIYKPSLCADVELTEISNRKPIYVTPYLLGGFGNSFELNEGESGYESVGVDEHNVGMDLKYGLTNNLTLDLTLNTDFAQVEADDQRINLSRYSLFYPEKRMFFQERSSIFNFSFDGFSRMFHSRRIGLSSYGAVPIKGGARLIGRVGEWDLGVLKMVTTPTSFGEDDEVPGENFGVLRLQRRVYNENSYMGGMLTSRTGDDGSYNHVLGLDGTIRVVGDEYAKINLAQSWDEATEETHSGLDLEAAKLRLRWERRTALGVGYLFNYARRGEKYRPGIGFESRSNYSTFDSQIGYAWLTPDSSKIYSHKIGLVGNVFISNMDGAVESAYFGPQWSYSGIDFSSVEIEFMARRELIPQADTLWLPQDAFVPSGTFSFYELTVWRNAPPVNQLRAYTEVILGTFYDGWKLSTQLSPSWNVSEYLTLSGSYAYDRGWFPDRSQDFNNHIIRLKSQVTLSTVYSGTAFIQYNRAAEAIGINLRLRYNPREGTDLYLVYDEGLNTNLNKEIPTLPLTSSRTLIVKYSTTFLTDLARMSR